MATGPGEHIVVCHFLHLDALALAAGPSEHIFARHLLIPGVLEVVAGPGKHIFARQFLRLDTLGVPAGPGEHLFERHFLRLSAPELAAGPGVHIFVCHFLRPDALEVAAGPGEHIFSRYVLSSDALEVAAGPRKHIVARHFLCPDVSEVPIFLSLNSPFLRHFGDFRRAKTGHRELKTGQKHLFWHSMWSKIIFEKSDFFFCTRWTLLAHFGTRFFGLPLAACSSPLGVGRGVKASVRAILRGENHQKWVVAGGLGALEIAV